MIDPKPMQVSAYLLALARSHSSWVCDAHVVVAVTPELVALIQQRRVSCERAAREDASLLRLCFEFGAARYFCDDIDVVDTPVDVTRRLSANDAEEFERSGYVLLPSEFEVPEHEARTECDEMILLPEGFAFCACPRWMDGTWTTDAIPFEVLQRGSR